MTVFSISIIPISVVKYFEHAIMTNSMPNSFHVLGSLTYIAPEVFENGDLGICSDLWALGCILFEMYTGQPPFQGDSFPDLMEQVTKKALPPLKVKGQFGCHFSACGKHCLRSGLLYVFA